MGLLDFVGTPEGQGLIGLAAGYAANARRGAPINGIGAGLLGGLGAYGTAQDRQARLAEEEQQRQIRSMQLKQLQTQMADQDLARTTASQFFQPGRPAIGALDSALPPEFQTGAVPMPAQAPRFDMQGFANARMSQNPLEGLKLMSELQKEKPINKLDAKDFTPASVQKFAQSGNYADLVRLDKLHFQDMGGAVAGLDPFTGRPVSTSPKTGNPFSDLVVSDGRGGVMPNSPLVGVKKDIARAGATAITVDAAPKAFWGDFGKSASDALFKEREGAQAATSVLQGVGEIRKAVAGGSFQGSGAELKLGVTKALNGLGANIDAQTVANTELFNAHAKQFVLSQIKTLGQNPSNADREFIEKTVPSLSTDPNALPKLLDFMETKARQQVQGFNTKIRSVQNKPNAGFMPFSLEVPEPAAPAPAAAAPAAPPTPMKGMVRNGYRFKGGDPADKANWEKQ